MSHDEEAGEKPKVRYRDKDGQWVELTSKRRPSGDPEIDGLWELPISDFEDILDDSDHPLHDKAREVSAELFAPIRSYLNTALSFPRFSIASRLPAYNFASRINPLGSAFSTDYLKHLRPKLTGVFTAIRDTLQRKRPPNWPLDIDSTAALNVIQDEGLPLVWVPRAFVVERVLAVPDRAARLQVLLSHRASLIEDCHEVLAAVSHESLNGQLPLAKKAVEAYAAGHDEAAQALAVVATETAVSHVFGRDYKTATDAVAFDPEEVPYSLLRLYAALAPIAQFYTKWFPGGDEPAPEALSRHVTVHQADQGHYTSGNAMVAILLVTSVLRALQEFHELADNSEEKRNDSEGEAMA